MPFNKSLLLKQVTAYQQQRVSPPNESLKAKRHNVPVNPYSLSSASSLSSSSSSLNISPNSDKNSTSSSVHLKPALATGTGKCSYSIESILSSSSKQSHPSPVGSVNSVEIYSRLVGGASAGLDLQQTAGQMCRPLPRLTVSVSEPEPSPRKRSHSAQSTSSSASPSSSNCCGAVSESPFHSPSLSSSSSKKLKTSPHDDQAPLRRPSSSNESLIIDSSTHCHEDSLIAKHDSSASACSTADENVNVNDSNSNLNEEDAPPSDHSSSNE